MNNKSNDSHAEPAMLEYQIERKTDKKSEIKSKPMPKQIILTMRSLKIPIRQHITRNRQEPLWTMSQSTKPIKYLTNNLPKSQTKTEQQQRIEIEQDAKNHPIDNKDKTTAQHLSWTRFAKRLCSIWETRSYSRRIPNHPANFDECDVTETSWWDICHRGPTSWPRRVWRLRRWIHRWT